MQEDVGIMKEMGLDVYRLSISWSRILPMGRISGGVNQKGVQYYNNLLNELLANGIQPFVTLFHWDLRQALEDEYGGFLSPLIAGDFRDHTELCFKEFGDRVKHWITLNEPWSYSVIGYAMGLSAPGRSSEWQHLNCTGGDSSTEPYLVAHNQILAHATAAKLYRETYQLIATGFALVLSDGVNVKGYFAWSLLDNFEWNSGYTIRFGINYVDYQNRPKKHPKHSAIWFKAFLRNQ
ncbi:hypothetical protein CDL15_Pgr026573 [Punica granatum]|uniref:Beta-glucosidase 12-like n=1 Tax=Punica granatum TaxID=22663 RepID=A0A218WKW9_PUNGR|nr:hypothetical protein CDL15_Pgr026573 [Punica granatum]